MSAASSKRLANLTNHLELKNLSNIFIFLQCCFGKRRKNCHLLQTQNYAVNAVHLISLFMTLVVQKSRLWHTDGRSEKILEN